MDKSCSRASKKNSEEKVKSSTLGSSQKGKNRRKNPANTQKKCQHEKNIVKISTSETPGKRKKIG